MCGIWVYLSNNHITSSKYRQLLVNFAKIGHRGPNSSEIIKVNDKLLIGFHRLSIVDPSMKGMAPFELENIIWVGNGEIYNYEKIIKEYNLQIKSNCDTEVIGHIYNNSKDMKYTTNELDGEFAIVLYDKLKEQIYYATDQLSMRPLFIVKYSSGDICLSSELIGLNNKDCIDIFRVPANCWGYINIHDMSINQNNICPLYLDNYDYSRIDAYSILEKKLVKNIHKKIHKGTRDFGFFLSGGIDSSIIASVSSKYLYPQRIKTFTIGFSEDATDVKYARLVAKHINSDHHEIIINMDETIKHLDEIIHVLGTFDETTIRASSPLFMGTKIIKERFPEIYIMYNGELADELFGSYLYFAGAPSSIEHFDERIHLLQNVHNFDGLRCDRVMSWFGIEARYGFFGKDLLKFALGLPADYFNANMNDGIEKKILRDAFVNYLPREVVWRTKNALSDATSVKSGWKEQLKKYTNSMITDDEFERRFIDFPYITPDSKENYYYRKIFDKYYKNFEKTIPYKWTPKWVDNITDSSASCLPNYKEDTLN